MAIKSGGEAEATELGIVVNKILDFIDSLDLPENMLDLQVVIVADGGEQGICATSGDFDGQKAVAATLMQHAAILLKHMGIDMEVMTVEDLGKLIEAKESV